MKIEWSWLLTWLTLTRVPFRHPFVQAAFSCVDILEALWSVSKSVSSFTCRGIEGSETPTSWTTWQDPKAQQVWVPQDTYRNEVQKGTQDSQSIQASRATFYSPHRNVTELGGVGGWSLCSSCSSKWCDNMLVLVTFHGNDNPNKALGSQAFSLCRSSSYTKVWFLAKGKLLRFY